MSIHEINIVDETACIMLKKENELIDSEFINKYHFDHNITKEELKEKIREVVKRSNVNEYVITASN